MAIERKFVSQNIREYRIKRFVEDQLNRVGLSDAKLKRTPLGDKIVIHASRPGLVVGRGGSNIQMLTKALKEEFKLENPQIEIEEVANPDLDADIVAERVINSLERFGVPRTKGIGHRALMDVMRAGALGVEIKISGRIPSQRARTWRFYKGYLKKSGDISVEGVRTSIKHLALKVGAIGVQVRIMPPDLQLPDNIQLTGSPTTEITQEETTTTETESGEELVTETVVEVTEESETTEEAPAEASAQPSESNDAEADASASEEQK